MMATYNAGSRRLSARGRSLSITFAAVVDGGCLAYDVVRGRSADVTTITTSPGPVAGSPWGRPGYSANGTTSNQVFMGSGFPTKPANGFTMFACFRGTDVSQTDQRVFKTCSDFGMGFAPRGNILQVINEGIGWYAGPGMSTGIWYSLAITVNAAMGINFYLYNVVTKAITTAPYDAGAGTAYGTGDGHATLMGQGLGSVAMAGLANVAWSDVQARRFLADPFAIVHRARPAMAPIFMPASPKYPVTMLEHL